MKAGTNFMTVNPVSNHGAVTSNAVKNTTQQVAECVFDPKKLFCVVKTL
jgi:hypothetical protein